MPQLRSNGRVFRTCSAEYSQPVFALVAFLQCNSKLVHEIISAFCITSFMQIRTNACARPGQLIFQKSSPFNLIVQLYKFY